MVALNVINADERLTFADELDALRITVFGGLYTSSGRLKDVWNLTILKLVNITEDYLNPEWLLAREKGLDFQEQVLYYEAFFKALEDESWVSGIFTERWDRFD